MDLHPNRVMQDSVNSCKYI